MDRSSESVATTSGALHRALDVLEFLAREGHPVSLAGIASAVETPKATLHRLLATLQARGYVVQDPSSGRYGLGVRCFELGSLWAQGLDLRVVAAPHLARLNEETLETVHLAVYEHGDVVYVDKLDSRHPIVALSYIGRRCPATCVSTGRAIMPFLPAVEIERVIHGPLPVYTEHTETDPERLMAIFRKVRQDGYATNESSYREGVCGVAAPIRDHTGGVVGSVGCCVPEPRFGPEDFETLHNATVRAAASISADLGWVIPGSSRSLAAER